MKNTEMRLFYLFVISFAFILNGVSSMKLRNNNPKHIVIDNGSSGLALNTVVRRTPTVHVVESTSPISSSGNNEVNFGNTNSNNAAGSFGKKALIVSKRNILKN